MVYVSVNDKVASFFCCDSITFKYKSFLAGIELNFGIANRITGFRFYFFFDRFEKFLKTLKIVYLCVCFLVLVGFLSSVD